MNCCLLLLLFSLSLFNRALLLHSLFIFIGVQAAKPELHSFFYLSKVLISSTRPTLTLLTLPALGNVRAILRQAQHTGSPASLAFAKLTFVDSPHAHHSIKASFMLWLRSMRVRQSLSKLRYCSHSMRVQAAKPEQSFLSTLLKVNFLLHRLRSARVMAGEA